MRALLAPLACAFALSAPGPAAAQGAVRLELVDTAVLRSPRLVESSGVTPSARRFGVLWTRNDSGDEPRLYATDSAGDDLGSLRVAGASNVDWEDIGSGPCGTSPGRCLFIADIGDNGRSRDQILVYRVVEPEPPAGAADTTREVPVEAATVLRYPDHPHDAEAIAVTPSGRILIVTKEMFGRPRLFVVRPRPGPQPPPDVDTLRYAGQLDVSPSLARLRVVTGAAVSPDGAVLAVRTYSSMHFFRLRGDSIPEPLTPPEGLTLPFVEPQGEGVAFLSAGVLVVTSERGSSDHATIARLRVRGLPR